MFRTWGRSNRTIPDHLHHGVIGGNGRYCDNAPDRNNDRITSRATTAKSPISATKSRNMTTTSLPIIPSSDCPCKQEGKFFCEHLQKIMYPRWAELCRTDPRYRAKWEAQRDNRQTPRQKPPPPPWLLCPHRGEILATLPGATLGTGCRTAQQPVYQCQRFQEPVVRRAAASHQAQIASVVPGYTGRTCRECEIPPNVL